MLIVLIIFLLPIILFVIFLFYCLPKVIKEYLTGYYERRKQGKVKILSKDAKKHIGSGIATILKHWRLF